jgi:hypothetical protein
MRAFLLLSMYVGCGVVSSAQQMAEGVPEKIWRQYLTTFLSQEYIDAHFQLDSVYRSPAGTATLRYSIRYGGELARTRTAGPGIHGDPTSGISQISNGGEIQSYFGPVKEYQLRIKRGEARAIMRANGCVLAAAQIGPAPGPAQNSDDIALFIGDYWNADGKYSPDYIPEGFYWVGARHPNEQTGTECMVDAETGAFSLKRVGPL